MWKYLATLDFVSIFLFLSSYIYGFLVLAFLAKHSQANDSFNARVFAALFHICACLFLDILEISSGEQSDIDCLKSIKHSLKDPYGYLNTSWNFSNYTKGFICKFTGVECWHPDENRVLNLRLSEMGLSGEFPLGIENCTSLTGIDLSNNELFGTLPRNISHLAGFLTSLDLSSNQFSGEIPVSLSNCTYLNVLKTWPQPSNWSNPCVISHAQSFETIQCF